MTAIDTTEEKECVAPVRVDACICLLLTMTDIGRVVMLRRLMAALRPEPEPASAPDTQLWPGQGPQSVSGGSQVYTVTLVTAWSQGGGGMSSEFGLPLIGCEQQKQATSWFIISVLAVTTKCVIQINCECEIQLFYLTWWSNKCDPKSTTNKIKWKPVSNNDSWSDRRQNWLDGRYFLDCPNLHLRTLLIRGFLHSLDPELAAGCFICVQSVRYVNIGWCCSLLSSLDFKCQLSRREQALCTLNQSNIFHSTTFVQNRKK